MKIPLIEAQNKSISARNWVLPKHTLPVFVGSDLAPIQSQFGEETTRRSGRNAWDQLITGTPQ